MKNEIEEAKINFPNGVIPPKVLMFYEFAVKNGECDLFNYESISNGKYFLSNLLTDEVINNFIPFYVDGAHGIFAIWTIENKDTIESSPVVYIDTEGTYTVCASNFDEFVFLFSKNLIVRISRLTAKYILSLKTGSFCKNPRKLYDVERLKEIDSESKKEYKCYSKFKTYVSDTMGIQFEDDPVGLIENAIKNNPNLLDYLKENNGLKIQP